MQRSTDRILTTHAGSLPRPPDLLAMIRAKARGEAVDERALGARVREAVAEVVRHQVKTGLDVIDDGEFGKPSFVTYVRDRLGGLEAHGVRPNAWLSSREAMSFPDYYKAQETASPRAKQVQMACTAPLTYKGQAQLATELDNLKGALKDVDVADVFVPCISPANIEDWNENKYYKSDEEYLFAIADAMNAEYKTIVDAGFLVQVDDPRLVSYYLINPRVSIDEVRKWAALRVEALNHALRNIPAEQLRLHLCWGNYDGPHHRDVALADIVDVVFLAKPQAISLEAANPRHAHEWALFERVKLPDGKLLIPGVIESKSNFIEHPELIAQRIARYANLVGRENVIAGSDCGYGTWVGQAAVDPDVVWAKLAAMAEGARIASRQFWK
jgi:5-methyltetrahydropteroyltriglutamate--homocysteine methyltransferase